MAKTQYHKRYELQIDFEYNDSYQGLGTVPDSFRECFLAVSYNGAMRVANTFVAIEEREWRKSGNYAAISKVTLTGPFDD